MSSNASSSSKVQDSGVSSTIATLVNKESEQSIKRRGSIVSLAEDDPTRDWVLYSQLLPPEERCELPKVSSEEVSGPKTVDRSTGAPPLPPRPTSNEEANKNLEKTWVSETESNSIPAAPVTQRPKSKETLTKFFKKTWLSKKASKSSLARPFPAKREVNEELPKIFKQH